MDEGTNVNDDSQIVNEMQDTEDVIKPENSPTRALEASPPSPQFECYFQGNGPPGQLPRLTCGFPSIKVPITSAMNFF